MYYTLLNAFLNFFLWFNNNIFNDIMKLINYTDRILTLSKFLLQDLL